MTTHADFDARSLLFIPADAERFIAKGAERGADVIILDLEDGVAPTSKPKARAALPSAVKQLHAGGATVFVRVNNEPELLANDVAAAVASGADGIVMPKVESPQELEKLDADLAREEHFAGGRSRWCA
jgi:citrate lyase subunit beta/citryl-CoA lyase